MWYEKKLKLFSWLSSESAESYFVFCDEKCVISVTFLLLHSYLGRQAEHFRVVLSEVMRSGGLNLLCNPQEGY